MKMNYMVGEDFCADRTIYSSDNSREYHYYPKLKITTDNRLTEVQKEEINRELVNTAIRTLEKMREED